MLGSLDLLSKGRACWNVVTSATEMEALNLGLDGLPPQEERYDRGDEVLEACCALWDDWAEDALVMDRESGVFADPAKVKRANYAGRYVRTRGPLSIPRSPQGRPVFLQAGASPRGRAFAARWAEAIFCTPHSKADAQAFYADIKARTEACGRPPGHCAVLPSIAVVVGETDSIAREKSDYLDALADPELVLAGNSHLLGVDLSRHSTEADVLSRQGNQGIQGSTDRVAQLARAEGLSFADAASKKRLAGGFAVYGSRSDGGLVPGRRLRRIHRLAHRIPADVRGIWPAGRARAAAPRSASDRIQRSDATGEPPRALTRWGGHIGWAGGAALAGPATARVHTMCDTGRGAAVRARPARRMPPCRRAIG